MVAMTHQALRFKENLTLPSVQVIVMSANMGCSHCQQRVSTIISKINGLQDYVVDVRNKEVTVRGVIDWKAMERHNTLELPATIKNRKKISCFSALFRSV